VPKKPEGLTPQRVALRLEHTQERLHVVDHHEWVWPDCRHVRCREIRADAAWLRRLERVMTVPGYKGAVIPAPSPSEVYALKPEGDDDAK